MFIGSTFAGCPETIYGTGIRDETVTTITLKNMILDELYATKDVLIKFDWNIPTDWTFNTYLHALYHNDLYAGNVTYLSLIHI